MRRILSDKIIPAVLGILLFFILFFSVNSLKIEDSSSCLVWKISDCSDPELIGMNLKFPFILKGDKNVYVKFHTEADKGDCDSLIVPEVDAGVIKLYMNGIQTGIKGDEKNLTAVLYPKALDFSMNFAEDKSIIGIELKGLGKVSMVSSPFPVKRENFISRIQLHNLLKSDAINSTVSVVLMMGIVLIFMSFALTEVKNTYQFLGMALVFSAMFLANRVYTETRGTLQNYIFLEKIFYISSHICVFCLMRGIELVLNLKIKISRLFLFVQVAMIIILAVQFDMDNFIFFTNIGNLINFSGITIIFLEILFAKNTRQLFTLTFLGLILIHDIILRINDVNHFFLNPYGQLIGVVGIAFFIVTNIKVIRLEKETAVNKSMKDPLTGIFNRNILYEIDYGNSDYIVLMDMDNLKHVNDNYGHDEGDRLIVEFVKVLRSHVRNEDVVIRIGGDEFLAILRNCKRKNVIRIMSRVKDEFYLNSFKNLGNFSYGMVKYSGNIMEDISRADNKMYMMKKEKPGIAGNRI